MDIVLGVSMTPTTVRMALVEGEDADGATVDHDVFDIDHVDGAASSSPADQVVAAILGTRESAEAGGHRMSAIGVAWRDHNDAADLRDALAAHGIDDVTLVSELHAAGALAQAAGRAVGQDRSALLFIEGDTATLSVVETDDGSIVKVDSRSLHSADAMAVLADTVNGLEEEPLRPDGIFVLGSGVDVDAVKETLDNHVTIPVSAPKDAEMALARGAALAAANVPKFDAATVGLAYSQDPDGTTAGKAYPAEDPSTDATELVGADDLDFALRPRKAFPLVGSSLTAIFVVGVVALVISLAVSIRPTVDTRPNPGESAVGPTNVAPPPEVAPIQQPPAQQPAPSAAIAAPPSPPPAVATIQEPVPVVQQQAAPKTAWAEAPAPAPKAAVTPAPAAVPAPAPDAPPTAEPAALPPAPAPAGVPYAPAPAYSPYSPAPAYSPYSPGPEYGPPSSGIPILPPYIGLGPGPGYGSPSREYGPGPGWYPPGSDRYGRGGWGDGPGWHSRSPMWPWGN